MFLTDPHQKIHFHVPDTRLTTESHPLHAIQAEPFHRTVLPDGQPWLELYRIGEAGYLLRFPALADFTVSSDGKKVAAHPASGVAQQTIDHLYLNQVLPLALSRQFKLVLHASAIEIDHFAVAFVGDSGRGKSTLAASFSTSGHRFLTDDGLRLEKAEHGFLIQPSHPSIRLWEDSRQAIMPITTQAAPPVAHSSKSRLLADNNVAYCDQARPLHCLYFLGKGNTNIVSIEPVSGRDAMIELVRHSFLLDIEEREMLMHQFAQLAELARTPMFFRLDYPRQYTALAQVREAVIRHAAHLR